MAIRPKVVKVSLRERKKQRLRKRIRGTDQKPRLCVFKSGRHMYAQLVSDESRKTIAAASTLEEGVMQRAAEAKIEEQANQSRSTKSAVAAQAVGFIIGQRAKEQGVGAVVFDRNGFLYHGRVKAVADGARQAGLQF